MREGFSGAMIKVAIAVLAVAVVVPFIAQASAQMPGAPAKAPPPALTTSWGDPDLQGTLDRRDRYAAATLTQVCQSGIFHRAPTHKWTGSVQPCRDASVARSATWRMSPEPTMMSSHRRSAPARAHRGLSIRPMAGYRR